ncbi:MAG: hypothetical protein SPI12_00655 [Actinomycetaceae bacterium]|nr:hypothetical protein [Actinomycetaceae bacterium]
MEKSAMNKNRAVLYWIAVACMMFAFSTVAGTLIKDIALELGILVFAFVIFERHPAFLYPQGNSQASASIA